MFSHDKLKLMKEQFAILPELPIVGTLKLTSYDERRLFEVAIVEKRSPTKMRPFFQDCFYQFEQYLKGKSQSIDLMVDDHRLQDFQWKVMREMKKIPFGKTATYKDLGQGINSRAYQAIGSACGKNPFLLIYPCHRIVGTNGPGGFVYGLEMKKQLLQLELGA